MPRKMCKVCGALPVDEPEVICSACQGLSKREQVSVAQGRRAVAGLDKIGRELTLIRKHLTGTAKEDDPDE